MTRARVVPPVVKKTNAPGVKGKQGGKQPGAGRPTKLVQMQKTSARAATVRIQKGDVLTGNWDPKNEPVPELPKHATPLDVLVEAMRRAYRLGGPIAASVYAEKAAPYLHAKISAIELKPPSPTGSSNPNQGARMRIEFVKPVKKDDTDV
jgi:hypothetical protein